MVDRQYGTMSNYPGPEPSPDPYGRPWQFNYEKEVWQVAKVAGYTSKKNWEKYVDTGEEKHLKQINSKTYKGEYVSYGEGWEHYHNMPLRDR